MVAGERSAMPSDRAASSGQWTAAMRAQPPQKKKTGAQRNAVHSGRRKWELMAWNSSVSIPLRSIRDDKLELATLSRTSFSLQEVDIFLWSTGNKFSNII